MSALADLLRSQAKQLTGIADSLDGATTGNPNIAVSELDAILNHKPFVGPGGPGNTTYRFAGDPAHVTAADVDAWHAAGSPAADADGRELSNLGVPLDLYKGGHTPTAAV